MVMAWFCHHVYTEGSIPPKEEEERATPALSGTASCSPSIWSTADPAPPARAVSRVSIRDSSVLSSFSLTQLRIRELPLFCCSSTPYRMMLAARYLQLKMASVRNLKSLRLTVPPLVIHCTV